MVLAALEDVRAATPAEIADDVSLVADGMEALDGALAAVGYDFAALAAAAGDLLAAVDDPVFAGAGDRLGAYRSQVAAALHHAWPPDR